MSHDRRVVAPEHVHEWFVRDLLTGPDPNRPVGMGPHPHRRAGLTVWADVDGQRVTREFPLLDLDPEESRLALAITPVEWVGYLDPLSIAPEDEGWVTLVLHARMIPGDDGAQYTIATTEETP